MRFLSFKIKAHNADQGIIEGHGSIFGNIDAYGDIVSPCAFDKTLSSKTLDEIKFLWQHNSSEPIGSHIEMAPDDVGLKQKSQLILNDSVPTADKANSLAKRGIVNGLSIGYIPVVEEFDRATGVNILKEVDLMEVSLVTFPANTLARLTDVKCVKHLAQHKRIIEGILRDSGYSAKEALSIISCGVQATFNDIQSDSDEMKALAEAFKQTEKIITGK